MIGRRPRPIPRAQRRHAGRLVALLLVAVALPLQAATRAWLDPPRVAVGDPVVLNIESDQRADEPDLSPLQRDFDIGDTATRQQTELANGRLTRRVLFAVTLVPRVSGEIIVPPLRMGSETTAPLRLRVGAAAPAVPGEAAAFIQTEVDDATPYVQQSVGVTVRLFYPPMASGRLEQAPPQGAALQSVGQDTSYSRTVNGRPYSVVERHYMLVPDRSGRLTLPPAVFRGQEGRNWMNDLFGEGSRELRARGPSQVLEVQPQPDAAPQPWLPLRSLRLRYVSTPQSARAGDAATVTVEAVAVGATAAQLPELPVPDAPGAQVFAEPAQVTERFVDGQPQVTVTRRYSVVPEGAGRLTIGGLRQAWWDVGAGRAATATLPPLDVQVAPGTGSFAGRDLPAPAPSAGAAPPGGTADGVGNPAAAAAPDAARGWKWLALGLGVLWLLTLRLWWRRGHRSVPQPVSGPVTQDTAGGAYRPRHATADLKRALETGTLDEVADVLRGMAPRPLSDLDQLTVALADASQREAIDLLRRARWADGDGTRARQHLREAFAQGPRWALPARTDTAELLPPLYPR